jgi:hypothetical protein
MERRKKPKVEPTLDLQDLEDQSFEEMSEIEAAFKARAKDEQSRFDDAVDVGYYRVIVCQNTAMMSELLRKMGLDETDLFIDGMEIAKKLGITLETAVPRVKKERRFGGDYLKRVLGK